MKKCARCLEIKATSEFNRRARSLDGLHSYCRDCSKQHYKDNIARHSANVAKRNKEERARQRAWIVEYKESNPCTDCGVYYPACVMDFDHLRDKKRNVSQMATQTDKAILEEIEKCELVCSNCHRIRTHARRMPL